MVLLRRNQKVEGSLKICVTVFETDSGKQNYQDKSLILQDPPLNTF